MLTLCAQSMAEPVIHPDAQDARGISQALREDRTPDIVIEDRAVAEVDVEILYLRRPFLVEHRLDTAAHCPPDDRSRVRAERAVGGNVAVLSMQPAHRQAAGQVRQNVIHRETGAAPESRKRFEV